MQNKLTIDYLIEEAGEFAEIESNNLVSELYGVTDGKVIGTHIEQNFKSHLSNKYDYDLGSSALGIDIPELNVDIKVTSIKQPQSSCPFRSASQKIYGLGYHILLFVYEKKDFYSDRNSVLNMHHTIFIDKERTGDFQTTQGILNILNNSGNKDDILAFIYDKNLPVDEIGANQLADMIINNPPALGYLTISNALQWRLQYSRVIRSANIINGIWKIR